MTLHYTWDAGLSGHATMNYYRKTVLTMCDSRLSVQRTSTAKSNPDVNCPTCITKMQRRAGRTSTITM